MDILKTLTDDSKDLISEDLDYFITELETGEYTASYKKSCLNKIDELRKWMSCESSESEENSAAADTESAEPKDDYDKLLVDPDKIVPGIYKPEPKKSDLEILKQKLDSFRKQSTYKSMFKSYVTTAEYLTEEFIDKNFGVFENYEVDLLVSVKDFSEDFLEKYFDVLDLDKVARYQIFSESFFMKHYTDFDCDLVLNKGKNEWRKKENRSKQLDVFLRLKGVRL